MKYVFGIIIVFCGVGREKLLIGDSFWKKVYSLLGERGGILTIYNVI